MIVPLIFLSSLPVLLSAVDATTCAGKSNLCSDQVTGCTTIFPQTAGVPSPLCYDYNYQSFADLCHKTCLICCVEPCVDVNPRCSSWNADFCTNTFYTDEFRWDNCRKKCNLC